MIIKINFDSEIPIYMQIKNEIIKGIAKKEIEIGQELPSVRGLAEDIEVNMHTVNKAYSLLKDEGYIKIDRRKGAMVDLNLDKSNEVFKNSIRDDLRINIAECINRNITKDDIEEYIKEIYNELKGGSK
ncbi:GntR family transcriptional regulator [Clostridium sp.]|uniref:GntR family transcriptional regulator n=1 Tax=Clostridium sp. TaxID=1506 RepID=UPI002627B529|nr:GntR family transcriptional regulator [Clostridium sp.]